MGGSNIMESSVVFQALQQQMSQVSTLTRKKKTKNFEQCINSRIFEPPAPPKSPNADKVLFKWCKVHMYFVT